MLVIEDHDIARRALCELLDREGFDSYGSVDGAGALAEIEAAPESIDVALVDVHLPDGNGPELVEDLRAIATVLPVIYVSGRAPGEISLQLELKERYTSFVQKPIDPDELLASIRNIVP